MEKGKEAGVNRDNITIVLNRPKYDGNIGAVARAAKNMGFRNIAVVKRHPPDREKILQTATHLARDIADGIVYRDDFREAVAGFQYIVGMTARTGAARRPLQTPHTLALELADLSQNNRVALLFGPEDLGLTNEETRVCHELVCIPTSDELRSINLSHAVMIICYELSEARLVARPRFTPRLAGVEELEGMYEQLKSLFLKIDFIPQQNPERWMLHVRRFLSRQKLYSREVRLIRGICRQLANHLPDKKS